MSSIEQILLAASALLFLSVLVSKASSKLGIPALLLFLILGMLAGSEGPGGIYFDDAGLAQSLGVIALTLILFSGGLDTEWSTVRPVVGSGLALSTVGVLITALLVGVFANLVLGFSALEGVLLGAIVSSTDAAAVFSVLRARSVSLRGQIRPLLELESGSNDPIAVFLTIALVSLLTDPSIGTLTLVPLFIRQMLLGAIIGFAMGKLAVRVINGLSLEYEGLYPVLTLSLVLLSYGIAAYVGGSGFLGVYILGLVLGNSEFIQKRGVRRFHDGLAWLMQIAMFLTLGLLVFPGQLITVVGSGLLVSLFLMFIARPMSVFLTLAFSKFRLNEKAIISWVGLRGAVPIVLATFPLLAGVPKADIIFNVVFFIVLTSVLLQGSSIPLVARWLRVDAPRSPRPRYPLSFEHVEGIKSELNNIEIPHSSPVVGKKIVEIGFPRDALIVLISRQNNFIIPRGGTVLEAGDSMLLLADKADLSKTNAIVSPPDLA